MEGIILTHEKCKYLEEKAGDPFAMNGHPVQYYPDSEEDIYNMYKYICDSTNLAEFFYPARLKTITMHFTYLPVHLITCIVKIPNVVAPKIVAGISLAFATQCFDLARNRLLVYSPIPERWFFNVSNHGQQRSSHLHFYMFQIPENPRIVNMFDLLTKGEVSKAFDIYGEKEPINESSIGVASVAYFDTEILCCTVEKYYHWCNGGNGGMPQQPVSKLHDYHRQGIRAALKVGGLTPREVPEEKFLVGRVNYAKSARIK
jgi:4-hydroxy-tetrahydrodipicolinate synthase